MYYLQAFKILALGYWRSEQKWKAYGILAVVLILNLLTIISSYFLTIIKQKIQPGVFGAFE